MEDELKLKMTVEGDVDEDQLKQTGEKAGKIVGDAMKEQKLKLTLEKSEMEKNLRTVNKTLDEFMKKGENGVLLYRAKLEKNEFETRIKEINQQLDDLNTKASKSLDVNAMGHLFNSGFFQKIGDGVVSLGKKVLQLGDSAQQAQISFTTMLGSTEKAKDLIKDLSDFASKTPFELSGIRDSAKQLLAMGVQAEDMIPTLKSLGDVSAGLNVPLERLALNYGQVLTQGKLTGKELKDFTTAGVPLIDELAKNLNKSKTEIQDMVSAGEISAQDMVDAFDSMTSAGGRFANLMEEQSQTLGGLLSNLNDEISLTGEAIGTELVPVASSFVGRLGNIVQGIRERIQENPKLTSALATFVGVAGGLIAIGGSLVAVWTLVAGAFGSVVLPVLGVVAAIGALVAVGVTLNSMYQETQAKLEYAGETYESLTEKIKENKEALEELNKQLEEGLISIEEYEEKKKQLEDQEGKLKTALDNTYMRLEDVNRELQNLSDQNISNEQKLKKLQEIKDKAFSTMKTVEELKLSLASLDGKLATLQDVGKNGYNFNLFTKSGRDQFKLGTKLLGKKVGSWFGLSESPEDYLQGIYNEKEALEERLTNYDEYKNKEAEIDKQIADLEVEIEKDKIKEINKLNGGGGSGGSKKNNELEQKKKELKEKRDLMIKDTQESELSEEDKYQKMLDIANWYKNELIVLQNQETDQLIKNAERQLKAKEEQYKKESSYYDDIQKVADKAKESMEKYKKAVEDVGKEWDKVKDKAEETLRATNNSIKELDADYEKDIVSLYNETKQKVLEGKKDSNLDYIGERISLKDLMDWQYPTINGVDIDKAIEYKKLVMDLAEFEKILTDEQKKQAEQEEKLTKLGELRLEYEKQRAVLVEKRNILEAIANGTLDNAGVQYKDASQEVIQYFDNEKQQWVDINDFKNSEYARDVLDNQTALNQKLTDLKAEHENEIKAYGDQVLEIKKNYEQDTKNYKAELENKKKAFADYVRDMNELAASLSTRARAYGGSLLSGQVSLVGENGPEQIIARQSSYVQPSNAVNNNSVIYNNQSSLSINGLEFGSYNSVDEMLAELKNRLTYRS